MANKLHHRSRKVEDPVESSASNKQPALTDLIEVLEPFLCIGHVEASSLIKRPTAHSMSGASTVLGR